jgi:hypothetical protein
MADVKIVKFVSGETAVTECKELTLLEDGFCGYELKNPIVILPTPEGVGMMPLSPFGKGDLIKIRSEHILFTDDPDDEISNVYKSKFGGIVTASGFNVIHPSR